MRIAGLLGVALVAGCVWMAGAESPSPDRGDDRRLHEALRTENEALKTEIEALRKENQTLRRELVARGGTAAGTVLPVKGVGGEAAPVAEGEETGFWLSSRSHIRHNPRCRNYRKVKGCPCGPNDGRPCKACGG